MLLSVALAYPIVPSFKPLHRRRAQPAAEAPSAGETPQAPEPEEAAPAPASAPEPLALESPVPGETESPADSEPEAPAAPPPSLPAVEDAAPAPEAAPAEPESPAAAVVPEEVEPPAEAVTAGPDEVEGPADTAAAAPEETPEPTPQLVEAPAETPVEPSEVPAPPPAPVSALAEVTLEELPERLRAATARAGWTSLMPVQARAIPYLLSREDAIVQARTGSGKTGAFLLPLLERLDPAGAHCQALVLVPTRELARQVAEDAKVLLADSGLRSAVVYGGVGYREQLDALREGAHLVVGTPGRVLDHLLKRNLNLDRLKLLIFDEADRMLSMGFYPDMKQLQRYLPPRGLQSCMFSATFPGYVLRTAREFIPDPEFISLSQGQVHVTDIQHIFYDVPGMDKDRALVRIIEIENPASAIIFCNTKARVHYVTVVLQRFGYDADELSADLSQADRERVLERVRRGTLRFLVATDVAARGLDVPELSHVFQYEPPEDPEAYIHRAGRTGRAGASGVAITLVSELEKFGLKRIAQRFGIDMEERPAPQDSDVEAVVTERLTALLEARLRGRDRLQTERSQRFLALARTLAENEDESTLIAMLLDDYYQQTLHAPVVPPPAEGASGGYPGGAGSGGGGKRRRPRR